MSKTPTTPAPDRFNCNCGRQRKSPGTSHEPWCDFLKTRPPVQQDPRRLSTAETLRSLTGGGPVRIDLTEYVGFPASGTIVSTSPALAWGRHMRKWYLGDGVYVDVDERGVVLTTENGIAVTNTIVLEPEVWTALHRYVEQLEGSES